MKMFKEQKTSPYAKMYLVTPAIYERLKKCIDSDELKQINKDTFGDDEDKPNNLSNTVIQNIATEEIIPPEPEIQAVNDMAHDPPIEHLEPVPGPSSRPYHVFKDPQGNEYIVPEGVPTYKPNKKRKFQDNENFNIDQPSNITELNDMGVQTDMINTNDKSTQFKPEVNNVFTQTDLKNEKLYVKKPIIEGKICPNYPMLPLSKCKPKEKQVPEFHIENQSNTIANLKPRFNQNVRLPMTNDNIENISSIKQMYKPKVTLPLDDTYDYIKDITSRKIHVCGICKKEFKRKWSLTRHYQTVHRGYLAKLKNNQNNQTLPMLNYNNDINKTMVEEGFPPPDISDTEENMIDGPIRPHKRFSNKKNFIQQGFPPNLLEQNVEEPMIDEPIRSRKRALIKSSATPIQPKYRQMMEVGYKRKSAEAKLPEYQEKKLLRSERPKVRPKRYENWGL